MKVAIIAILAILMTPLATHVLAQTDDSTTSSIEVGGFFALEDLKATLTWGNTTLEKMIGRGSTSVKFEVPKPNIRSQMVLKVEPNGLELVLAPTATGYSPLKVSLGDRLKAEALRVVVKEALIILDIEINVTPAKAIHKLAVDNESIAFTLEARGSSVAIRPSSALIIDPQRTVVLMVEGDGFTSTLTIRRGLSESDINVVAEAVGRVDNIRVEAKAAEVLALQELMLPIKLVNVTQNLKVYKPITVAIAREEGRGGESSAIPASSQPLSGQAGPPGLNILIGGPMFNRLKILFMASGIVALCLAVLSNKKWLAILALILLCLYFMMVLGGWGEGREVSPL
jgi:hypothetical protein